MWLVHFLWKRFCTDRCVSVDKKETVSEVRPVARVVHEPSGREIDGTNCEVNSGWSCGVSDVVKWRWCCCPPRQVLGIFVLSSNVPTFVLTSSVNITVNPTQHTSTSTARSSSFNTFTTHYTVTHSRSLLQHLTVSHLPSSLPTSFGNPNFSSSHPEPD